MPASLRGLGATFLDAVQGRGSSEVFVDASADASAQEERSADCLQVSSGASAVQQLPAGDRLGW